MKCLDCKFSHGQPGALECRGRPPLGDERFPLVRDNQWCGTFEVAELNVVSPHPKPVVSITKKSHAKTPRRKGKHGQETSSQEA